MTTQPGPSSDSALDTLFGVLASKTRRELLGYLDDESRPVPVERLAAALGSDGRRVAIELHHKHLPRLTEAGLVEWDRDRGTVTRPSTPAIGAQDVSVSSGGRSVRITPHATGGTPTDD